MNLRVVVSAALLLAIILLSLFSGLGGRVARELSEGTPGYNCEPGLPCASCVLGGAACECKGFLCSCGNTTVSREECGFGRDSGRQGIEASGKF